MDLDRCFKTSLFLMQHTCSKSGLALGGGGGTHFGTWQLYTGVDWVQDCFLEMGVPLPPSILIPTEQCPSFIRTYSSLCLSHTFSIVCGWARFSLCSNVIFGPSWGTLAFLYSMLFVLLSRKTFKWQRLCWGMTPLVLYPPCHNCVYSQVLRRAVWFWNWTVVYRKAYVGCVWSVHPRIAHDCLKILYCTLFQFNEWEPWNVLKSGTIAYLIFSFPFNK